MGEGRTARGSSVLAPQFQAKRQPSPSWGGSEIADMQYRPRFPGRGQPRVRTKESLVVLVLAAAAEVDADGHALEAPGGAEAVLQVAHVAVGDPLGLVGPD